MVVMSKVLHLLFTMIWIGSLFLLPQLLIWEKGEDRGIARKLYYRLQLPSMLLALTFGLVTFFLLPKNLKAGWFHMKMTAVVGLITIDSLMRGALRTSFAALKWRLFQFFTLIFVFMALFAVYGVRNKEREWQQKNNITGAGHAAVQENINS